MEKMKMNFREFFKTSNFTKVAEGDSNWDYYVLQYKDGSQSIVSLAKDNSGYSDSCFGDFDYFQRFINSKNSGEIKLTAYGETLFRKYGSTKIKTLNDLVEGKCIVVTSSGDTVKEFEGYYDKKLNLVFMCIPSHYEIQSYIQ